jgi:peroxiredoxin Q/BCP
MGRSVIQKREKVMSSLEGKKAPEFELDGSDGAKHSLRDYTGKTVVIYFYPKDNTPGCTKEACGFRGLHQDLLEMGVALLGVSKDSLKSHDKFIRDFGLPFVLLSDPDAGMMKEYGAFGEKVMYGKKTMGTIRSTVIVGPEGTVLKHWQTVKKAEEHPAEVRAWLRER